MHVGLPLTVRHASIAVLLLAAGACSDDSWRTRYSAPYNTAATEEEARIWQRGDTVFQDRTDWASEPALPEEQRVYPAPISRPEPMRPDSLSRETGRITVGYMIERDGNVRDVRVLFSTNHRLDSLCVSGLCTWRYSPGTAAGKASLWMYQHSCDFR
jgi:hypothetical protein